MISRVYEMELQQENIIQSQDKKTSTSKEFHCCYCTKGFTERKNLVRHVRVVHHNIRPFSCEDCKKAFAFKHELVRHSKKGCFKFGEFRCEKCDKKFIPEIHYTVKYCPKCNVHFDSREKIVKKLINQEIVKSNTELSLNNFQNTSAVWNQLGQEKLNSLFTCKRCYWSFYTSRGLTAHRETTALKPKKISIVYLHVNAALEVLTQVEDWLLIKIAAIQ